jgi:hypothetical protein
MKKNWPVSALLVAVVLALTAGTMAYADEIGDLRKLIGSSMDSASSPRASLPPDLPADSAAVIEESRETQNEVIRITPDSTKILRLQEDAASVVVANPDHASVVLDSPRLLIIMPRQPGITSFTVLNAKGEPILERNVIVSGTAKQDYVRIRRVCNSSDPGCVANAYYYCPDGCYEVTPVPTSAQASEAPPFAPGVSRKDSPANAEQQTLAPSEQGGGPVIIQQQAAPGPVGSTVGGF